MIFVNKMDQMESIGLYSEKREEILNEIREKLSGNALEFAAPGDAEGYLADSTVTGKVASAYVASMSGKGAVADRELMTGKGTSTDGAAKSAAAAFAERILSDDALTEALALCDETLLNKFLEGEGAGAAAAVDQSAARIKMGLAVRSWPFSNSSVNEKINRMSPGCRSFCWGWMHLHL